MAEQFPIWHTLAKFLMIAGGIVFVIGLIIHFLPSSGFPRLPGDIFVKKEDFYFYFPISSCIVLSIVISLIVYLINRFF
jgi:hypothetical protein